MGKATWLLVGAVLATTSLNAQTSRVAKSAPTDTFPLEHGFYVDVNTPCGQAMSKMDVSLYEGKTLEGTRGRTCSVNKRALGPNRWQVKTQCPAAGYTPLIESEVTIKVTNRTSYDLTTTPQNGGQTYHMRLCRSQELPDPFRTVAIR